MADERGGQLIRGSSRGDGSEMYIRGTKKSASPDL